jgi:hypothetical protein
MRVQLSASVKAWFTRFGEYFWILGLCFPLAFVCMFLETRLPSLRPFVLWAVHVWAVMFLEVLAVLYVACIIVFLASKPVAATRLRAED